ncbi:MAG: phospholipid carrier-dependent glycosyltransferase [Oligoflexia bacterium]|nr:phospholipid carrier-dependent glycosyltransferase [Oligoflexia bacterium]
MAAKNNKSKQPISQPRLTPASLHVLITSAALYVFSQILFLINIQFPRNRNFDEFHYVPAAQQFLNGVETHNWEHPPLAKELLSIGLLIFGDQPIGWRFMSTIFGSITLVAMYFWALALFRDKKTALWVALLTLANQLLYVQARIGMLDTFMFAFIALGMAAFTAAWNPRGSDASKEAAPIDYLQNFFSGRRLLWIAGACFGLATSCKWFGLIPWALCAGLVALVQLFKHWNVSFGPSSLPSDDDWYHAELWSGIRAKDWVMCLLVIPLVAYYLPFIPFLFTSNAEHGIWDILVSMQARMWDGQGRVVSAHPYMSRWLDWPTIRRPIWYAFDKEGSAPNEKVRGVLLLGNPFILWTGLLALIPCIWGWLVDRRRDAFLITAAYFAFLFSWAIIPRKIAFFYYYYPAGMVLSFALAYVFRTMERNSREASWARWAYLAVAVAFFIYFFPISAALAIPAESFRKWMWFSSWV